MLKIDPGSHKLLPVPRLRLRAQPLDRDVDLAGMITGSPAEFFSEIDEKLFVIGANVVPHADGAGSQTAGGVDLLALDLNGRAVAVIVEGKQKPSSFARALLCSEWLAGWEPRDFIEKLSGESASRLEQFLVAGFGQINRGQRLILIAAGHGSEIPWAARSLHQQCGIDISVLRAALANGPNGEQYICFRREFPSSGNEWATLVRPHDAPEALHLDAGPLFPPAGAAKSIDAEPGPASGQAPTKPSPLSATASKEEALRTLAGAFADYLGQTMAAVDGSAELALREAPRDASVRRRFEEISRVAERTGKLIDELFVFAGRGARRIQKLDPAELLRQVTASTSSLQFPNVELRTELEPDLPELEGDAAQIARVVRNLLDNAVEALPQQGGSICIRAGRLAADQAYLAGCVAAENLPRGDYLYIEVEDSGFGIDDDLAARMFDPFFTTKASGRGLGLSAALGIARNHGGALRVQSRPGTGSTFRILLPLPKTAAAGPARHAGKRTGAGNGRTVLVVDDQESPRTLACQTFEAEGFRVLSVADGWDALDVFAKTAEEIDVVLLDWMLPSLDAEEAFRAIRRIRNDTRIILCGPFPEDEAARRFNGKKLAAYIRKPFQPEHLAACVRHLLEQEHAPSSAKAG